MECADLRGGLPLPNDRAQLALASMHSGWISFIGKEQEQKRETIERDVETRNLHPSTHNSLTTGKLQHQWWLEVLVLWAAAEQPVDSSQCK